MARGCAACDNAGRGGGLARSAAGEGYIVPGRGLLRTLIVLAAAAGVAAFALRKLGIIGNEDGGRVIGYGSGSESSGDDAEDDSANK